MPATTYELVRGDLHRHGALRHAHPHAGPHEHPSDHGHEHGHGHSHGFVDESIKRSRDGVRAVSIALGILASTAAIQALVFALTGSLALLADLIHNGGDALTAIPLGVAPLRRMNLSGHAWAARTCSSDGGRTSTIPSRSTRESSIRI